MLYNGTIEYDLGFASLSSSTSYGRLKQDLTIDGTAVLGNLITFFYGTPLGLDADFVTLAAWRPPGSITGFKKFTQEVRLASPSDDKFEWLAGVYYTKEKGLIFQDINALTCWQTRPATDLPAIGIAEPADGR